MNLLESLKGLANKPQKPLHVGEVMTLWRIAAAFEDGRTIILGLLNHTADTELKRYLESYISDFEVPWRTRVKRFMKDEGISLPPATTDKAKADVRQVPPGAKFEDEEIATLVAAKLYAGIQVVQAGLLECLRYDLGELLLGLEAAAYRQAFVLRETMEKRGWLKVPPAWPARTQE